MVAASRPPHLLYSSFPSPVQPNTDRRGDGHLPACICRQIEAVAEAIRLQGGQAVGQMVWRHLGKFEQPMNCLPLALAVRETIFPPHFGHTSVDVCRCSSEARWSDLVRPLVAFTSLNLRSISPTWVGVRRVALKLVM